MAVRNALTKKIASRLRGGKRILERPLLDSRGKQAVRTLRFGTRGIADQFKDQTEYRGGQAIPWDRTQDFGTRKAPRKTMEASGGYRTAWLGGAGGVENISANAIEIGVDRGDFPMVAIHQGSASSVKVLPKKRTKGGKDWAMRFFLGLTYGVWLTKKRLEMGLKISRRRLSVSSDVRKAIALMVKNETRKALGVGVQGPRAVA